MHSVLFYMITQYSVLSLAPNAGYIVALQGKGLGIYEAKQRGREGFQSTNMLTQHRETLHIVQR